MKQTKAIDCHTHCYPEEVAADPRAWAQTNNEPHWAELVAPPDRKSIQDWATPEQMLEAMDHAGIDQAILLGWYWENESTCRWHNQVIADWVAHAPERFIGFASIAPNGEVRSQLEAAQALGLCGVGELHPGVQQFDASSGGWQTLSEWCVARDWPVNLHATEAAGHPHPGSLPTPLNDFIQMAAQAPDLKIILAHWGGGLPFFEQNPRLRAQLTNVYYDTAAGPLLYDPTIFQRVIDLVGPQKVLFGSDFPLRIFPRQQKRADFNTYLRQIQTSLDLPEATLEAILHRNIRDLLALNKD